jgi:cell division protein FtsW (lipid II flippase)
VTTTTTDLVQPPAWYRALSAVVATVVLVTAAVFATQERGAPFVIFAVLAVASAVYLVRGWRAGIELHPDHLVIRGFFSSRRLRKAQITAVDRFPFVDWVDEHDITHQSLAAVYSGGSNGGGGAEARANAKRKLVGWFQS